MKSFTPHLAPLVFFLSLLASGCGVISDFTTEVYYSLDNPVPVRVDEAIDTLCTIKYSIDKKNRQIVIFDQRKLDYFLYSMLLEAEKGSIVSVLADQPDQRIERKAFSAGKEPIIFTTIDNSQAKEWVKKMLLKGYKVSIIYDRKKKEYTCTAYQSN